MINELFILLAVGKKEKGTTMVDKETRDMEKHLQRTPKKKENSAEAAAKENSIQEIKVPAFEGETFEDKVYREISLMNGQINRMNLGELKTQCKRFNLDCYGKKDPLKRRLKEHYKENKLVEAGLLEPKAKKNADFLLIIDFEATCEEKNPAGYPHEIIEFPAVLISCENVDRPEIIDVFHSYVKPVINPTLSEFCKALTGIEQNTVDAADTFDKVLHSFEKWMQQRGMGLSKTFMIVTDGPFDMGRFMYLQCQQSGIEFPACLRHWANLRKVFINFYKESFYAFNNNQNQQNTQRLPGLQTMLAKLDMDFEGHPHCGLDDAKNIARIVVRLLKDKAVIRINEKFQRVAKGVDDSNRCNGKLFSVVPVPRREADLWFRTQKTNLISSSKNNPNDTTTNDTSNLHNLNSNHR